MAGPSRGKERAGRTEQKSNAVGVTFLSRSLRPGAVSVKRSLGQRARTCFVGGRLVLHRAKRAPAARHETRELLLRRFEAAAADLAQCR